ncbi:MAG: hypothetical protein D6732_28365 [Methanobacteriota archaeon]|nr:MAG: hypothetical protein D6732_28365 [Euryarchaeota archaeon]
MKTFKTNFTILAAFWLVLIMITTPMAAPPQSAPRLDQTDIVTDIKLEYATFTAGIGSSALVGVHIYGGTFSYPSGISPTASGFSDALAWIVYGINQSGVENYLTRDPVPLPDGVNLQIVYPSSLGTTSAVSAAFQAKAAVEAEYGISMTMIYGLSGPGGIYFAFSGGNDSAVNQVLADVQAAGSGGFSDAFGVFPTTGIRGAGFALLRLGTGDQIPARAGFFVDPNGIVDNADGSKTLSTMSILGMDLNPASDSDLSRIRINVPYPITPLSITPDTSNRLPHVTGTAFWDVKHPRPEYSLGDAASDYQITYNIGMDRQFPMVEGKLSIDQGLLNTQGVLKFNYDFTNTGQATAKNIDMALPLGPDIQRILDAGLFMYRIKPAYDLDESFSTQFNISMDAQNIPGVNDVNFNFLSLNGWYVDANTSNLVDWNTSTLIELKYVDFGVASLNLSVVMPDGAPQSAVDAVYNFIVPAADGVSVTQPSDIPNLVDAIKNAIPAALNATYLAARDAYYERVDLFQLNAGDFTIEERPVGLDENTINQTFLVAHIDELGAGLTTSLSFNISNVPSQNDRFAQMALYRGETTAGGVTYNTLTLESKQRDYLELMQYIFALADYNGMPLSFQIDPSHSPIPGATGDVFISFGLPFTWENTEGFEFFGLANGQNIQFADDQAVVTATVRFANNQQVFTVGDEVTIIANVTNNGDATADDVIVHLFHARLGRDWNFVAPENFEDLNVGSLAPGESKEVSVTVTANSFIGYHPVFGVVEFVSEKGQAPPAVTDFFDKGVTQYQYGGESKHFVTSTLTGGLLLPADNSAKPAVPEPRIEVTTSTTTPDADGKFTYSITLTNVGEAPTNVTAFQTIPTSEFDLLSSSSTTGTLESLTFLDSIYVKLDSTPIGVGESITITLELQLKGDSGTLPSAVATFEMPGQSSLGDQPRTGVAAAAPGQVGGSFLFNLAASAAAQEQSEASATEQGSSSAYSSSGAIFASSSGGGEISSSAPAVTSRPGSAFVGYEGLAAVAMFALPITLVAIKRKRH